MTVQRLIVVPVIMCVKQFFFKEKNSIEQPTHLFIKVEIVVNNKITVCFDLLLV